MTAKRDQENMLRDEEIEESPKTHWAIESFGKGAYCQALEKCKEGGLSRDEKKELQTPYLIASPRAAEAIGGEEKAGLKTASGEYFFFRRA